MGGSPGLVVWVTTHVWEVVGSNPGAIYWMDIFSNWFVVKIVLFVWKDLKHKRKRPGLAHLKKFVQAVSGSVTDWLRSTKPFFIIFLVTRSRGGFEANYTEMGKVEQMQKILFHLELRSFTNFFTIFFIFFIMIGSIIMKFKIRYNGREMEWCIESAW